MHDRAEHNGGCRTDVKPVGDCVGAQCELFSLALAEEGKEKEGGHREKKSQGGGKGVAGSKLEPA